MSSLVHLGQAPKLASAQRGGHTSGLPLPCLLSRRRPTSPTTCTTGGCSGPRERPRVLGPSSFPSHGLGERMRTFALDPSVQEKEFPGLFNRGYELDVLKTDLLDTPPTGITVVVGPRGSGKTSLFNHFLHDARAKGSLVAHVNCRDKDTTTSSTFLKMLEQQASATAGNWKDIAQLVVTPLSFKLGGVVSLRGEDLAKKLMEPSDNINDVISKYRELLVGYKAWKSKEQGVPIICIDDCQVFTEWPNSAYNDLKALLRFFLQVTSETNLAHVVLVTSKYTMVDFFEREIGPGYCRVEVIGNLIEAEAREFFCQRTLPEFLRQITDVSDDEWRVIHKACDGNPRLLNSVAACYRGSWEQAVEEMVRSVENKVLSGLGTNQEDQARLGFRPDHYAKVVMELLNSPRRGAVPKAQMEEVLGPTGNSLLLLMDLYTANHTTGPSPQVVVMAPTPACFYVMRKARGNFEKALSGPAAAAGGASGSHQGHQDAKGQENN